VLAYQLTSLAGNPPLTGSVLVTVFYERGDRPTLEMVQFFQELDAFQRCRPGKVPCDVPLGSSTPRMEPDSRYTLSLRAWPLPRGQLLKRAIGRNLVAKETTADLVWYTDCDYMFAQGIFDRLFGMDLPNLEVPEIEHPCWYPRVIHQTATRQLGDELAAKVRGPGLYVPDPCTPWIEHPPKRAIGGVQICRAETVRKMGYVRGTRRRFHQPLADDAQAFERNWADRWFRMHLGCGRGQAIDLPGCFRIRQSKFGQVDSLHD
jgi:hypothetical protein